MKKAISKFFLAAGLLACGVLPQVASAGVIVSATAVTTADSFPDATFGNPNNLINQGGLAAGFVSGVTDFATYLASNPQHTTQSAGAEWFTPFGNTAATLTFNLGSVLTIGGVAAWVDEFWGAGNIAVFTSLDGLAYSSVGSFTPTDWATNVTSYSADVFSFSATSAQYVQLVLSGCPQPLSVAGGGCGMGEVAFDSVANTVPEPSTLALLGLSMLGFAATRRRNTR
ncbi:MAG: PEP-CTERM sorting domain-containing protein [Rhizobacter sp.]